MDQMDSDRHPSASEIQRQVDNDLPVSFGVPGTPDCQIRILPADRLVEILVADDESDPDVKGLRSLRLSATNLDGKTWRSLSIEWVSTPVEAYLFACAVTDRVQLSGESLAMATDVVLRGMKDLLRREDSLSRDAEVGLAGELVVLISLMTQSGVNAALDSWLGVYGEEHDFSVPSADLEVKTTTSEERTHWIASATQLLPAPGRPLRLVSIQLTPKNGPSALTLAELARLAMERAEGRGSEVESRLESVGYRRSDQDLYRTSWALRSSVFEYLVDDSFPRLTSVELAKIGPLATLISEVSYRVHLESLQPCTETIVQYVSSLEHL
jgi:hypothetical protein